MTRELLFSITKKDFKIQTFRAGGKGGQHQNKVETGVRIIHEESGATGECRDSRSQYQNKKTAFIRLTNSSKFKTWLNRKIYEETNKKDDIESKIEEMLLPINLKIEVSDGKNWITIPYKEEQD